MPRVTIRITDNLIDRLSARNPSISEAVREVLERYFHLVDTGKIEIQDSAPNDG